MLQAARPDSVIRAHESKPGGGQCLNSCCHSQRETGSCFNLLLIMVSLLSWAAADCRLFRRFNQRSPHGHVLVDGVHIKTGQGYHRKDGTWYTYYSRCCSGRMNGTSRDWPWKRDNAAMISTLQSDPAWLLLISGSSYGRVKRFISQT